LSADFGNLEKEVKEIEMAGADWLHLDIMDGNFVPNISFGPMVVKALRGHTNLFFDVHLMIENPDLYLEEFKNAGADMITVHQESTKHLHRTIQRIKSLGRRAGVSLTPATSILPLEHILPDIDLVLIMSVNPGFGGQSFIPESLEKIKKLKALAEEKNPGLQIQVDGGINKDNAKIVTEAGADILVAGSAVCGAEARMKAIKEIKVEYNE
jgi:ribulose-phosphate 3-epimerase